MAECRCGCGTVYPDSPDPGPVRAPSEFGTGVGRVFRIAGGVLGLVGLAVFWLAAFVGIAAFVAIATSSVVGGVLATVLSWMGAGPASSVYDAIIPFVWVGVTVALLAGTVASWLGGVSFGR